MRRTPFLGVGAVYRGPYIPYTTAEHTRPYIYCTHARTVRFTISLSLMPRQCGVCASLLKRNQSLRTVSLEHTHTTFSVFMFIVVRVLVAVLVYRTLPSSRRTYARSSITRYSLNQSNALKSYWSASPPLRPRHLLRPLAQPSSFEGCDAETARAPLWFVAAPFPCDASRRRRQQYSPRAMRPKEPVASFQ